MSEKRSKLIIVDKVSDDRALAYRNKPSVEIYPLTKEVGFSEFSYSWKEIIIIGKKLEELLEKDLVNVLLITVFLPMESESKLEDIVIKSYLELYLHALNDSRPQKFINTIKNRMMVLIKRKYLRNK